MPRTRIKFDGGTVTSRDRKNLDRGQLQQSTGVHYKAGDPSDAHKLNGRSVFGTVVSGQPVRGVALCQFDSGGVDRLVALVGDSIYGAGPATPNSFSLLASGLDPDAGFLGAAHYNDRWFLTNGVDRNLVLKPDGTTRSMGMVSPQEQPVVTLLGATGDNVHAGTVSAPSGASNLANASDGDVATFAGLTRSTFGLSSILFSDFNISGSTTSSHRGEVRWSLAGIQTEPPDSGTGGGSGGSFGDIGGSISSGFTVVVRVYKSENGGTTFTQVHNSIHTSAKAIAVASFNWTNGIAEGQLQIKVALDYVPAQGSPATLRVYDVAVKSGASMAGQISTTTGLYYAVAEQDQNENLPSPIGPPSALVVLSSHRAVEVPLPTPRNSNTTHFLIYRTADGGLAPHQLGLIGTVPATSTTFIDDFAAYPVGVQPTSVYPLLSTTVEDADIQVARDSPPPVLRRIREFKGSLTGLSNDATRALYYSIPGRPESWPEIYVITSFPLDEHDELVDCLAVGDNLVIATRGAMLRLNELPRVVAGLFNASEVVQIKGAPGCVGDHALTAVTVSGEPRAAWISPYGIFVTNGETYLRVSDTLDWNDFETMDKTDWVLRWDARRRVLIFAYSSVSGGPNDRYYMIHLDEPHAGKFTGPHYGKINALASGQVEGRHRMYSAHPSDGRVYLEDDELSGTDASNSYDSGGTSPLILKSGLIYDDDEFSVLSAILLHGDFGTGQTALLTWRSGRDSTSTEQTRHLTVSLAGDKGTLLDIARSGEWHELTITHLGTGRGRISSLDCETRKLAMRGMVKAS